MKRWSSLRRTAAPIPVALMAVSSLDDAFRSRSSSLVHLPFHGLGARRDRLDDIVVAGAAAEIAFELMTDGGIVEVVALAVDHVHRGHDHARGAVAALQPVMLAERLLHRMQRPVRVGEALDGGDVGAVDLPDEDGAGFD